MFDAQAASTGRLPATLKGSRQSCCTVAPARDARAANAGCSIQRSTEWFSSISEAVGRVLPHASTLETDLKNNTTWKLVEDIESLRKHLDIERWLVLGGSWGSTLALAYAELHPDCVTELILFGVTTGRHSEFDWLFRGGVAGLFPEQWERLRAAMPVDDRHGDLVEVYYRLLHDPDPNTRQRAAFEWCLWESATPEWPPATGLSPRFEDTDYAMAFARLVTHYVRHNAWLDDGALLQGADALAGIPGTMVNGRFDLQAPIGNAWELSRVWPQAELVIVDRGVVCVGTRGTRLTRRSPSSWCAPQNGSPQQAPDDGRDSESGGAG